MKINGVVCCVNYVPKLVHCLQVWRDTLDTLVVITTNDDKLTQRLCLANGVKYHCTDMFYANGAAFNKGAALSEAIEVCGLRRDWILSFDADILPYPNWRTHVAKCVKGSVYGSHRYYVPENGPFALDRTQKLESTYPIGFFQLFHAEDPVIVKRATVFDMCWPHAGHYDTAFTKLWHVRRRILLDIPLRHIGLTGRDWAGIGQQPATWSSEPMANPPVVSTNEKP